MPLQAQNQATEHCHMIWINRDGKRCQKLNDYSFIHNKKITPCGTICMIWRKRTTDWLKKTINLEPAPSECIFFRGCPTLSGGQAPVGASGGSEPGLPPLPSMCGVPASEAEETSDISAYSYLAGTPDAVESHKNQSHGSVHIEDVTHEREGPAPQEEPPVGPPDTTVSEAEESLQNLELRAQLRKKRESGPLINSYGSIISTQSSQYAMKKKKSQASLEVQNFNNLKGERAVSTEPLFSSLP